MFIAIVDNKYINFEKLYAFDIQVNIDPGLTGSDKQNVLFFDLNVFYEFEEGPSNTIFSSIAWKVPEFVFDFPYESIKTILIVGFREALNNISSDTRQFFHFAEIIDCAQKETPWEKLYSLPTSLTI